MAKDFLGVDKGLKHKPESAAISYDAANEGAIYNESNSKMHVQIAGADREILNNSQAQSLSNKYIDADLNSILNIDNDNIKAGAAIDESKLNLDHSTGDLYSAIQENASSISTIQTQLNHVQTLSGVANGSDNLGSFSGTILSNSETIKTADQKLSDAAENAVSTANSASSSVASVSGNLSSHTGNTSNPHSVTKSQILTGNLIVNNDVDNSAAIVESKLNLNYSTTSLSSSIASTAGTLSSHLALSSGVHGTSGSVVGTSDTQILTNKDIDGGTAANNHRITLPKDTLTNISSLTRKQGTLIYDTTGNKVYYDNGSSLAELGGGGSGGLTWSEATSNTTLAANYGYISNSSSLLDFTLPATAAQGSVIEIVGKGTGGWQIKSNTALANEMLYQAATSNATTVGYSDILWIYSTRYSSIRLICTVANTTWTVEFANGGTLQTVPGHISIPAAVVAYYHLDETSGSYVDSVGGYNLSRVGSPGSGTGKFGNAYTGAGNSGDDAHVSNSVFDFPQNRKYGIDFYLKVGSTMGAGGVTALIDLGGGAASANIQVGVNSNSGTYLLGIDLYAQNYQYRYIQKDIAAYKGDGIWHHVVATFDRASGSDTVNIQLYWDGTSAGTNSFSQSNAPTGGLMIANQGGVSDYTTNAGVQLNSGWGIDDVAIWKGTLPTGTDVTNRYNSGVGATYV